MQRVSRHYTKCPRRIQAAGAARSGGVYGALSGSRAGRRGAVAICGFVGVRARGQSVRLKGSSVEGIFVHRISSNKLWYRSPQRARDEDDAAEAFGLAALTDYSHATKKHQGYISSSS